MGLEVGPSFAYGAMSLDGPQMPTVVLMCSTCFYVRHFAWFAIKPPSKYPYG